jgi:hypothetical protein
LTLAAGMMTRADFSYETTRKSAGGAASGGEQSTKHYLKGQKMMIDTGRSVIIMDFEAQTFTSINNSQKTYTVTNFADLNQGSAGGAEVTADVKETGQRKNINGFDASEFIMTMQMDNPQTQQAGMKMQIEMDFWVSPAVPGSQELRAFYQRNISRFPWAAMSQGANPSMQKAMVDLQRKMAGMNGVPVLQIIRIKSAGNSAQMAQSQQSQAIDQARAKLEEMQKKGGPQAAAAAQALARMGGGSSSSSIFEITTESSNFSTKTIPDPVFAIPAGYQKVDK